MPDDVYDHIEMCEKQLDRYVEHRISSGSDKDVEDLWTATSRRFERNRPVQRLYDWRDKLADTPMMAKQIFQDARCGYLGTDAAHRQNAARGQVRKGGNRRLAMGPTGSVITFSAFVTFKNRLARFGLLPMGR